MIHDDEIHFMTSHDMLGSVSRGILDPQTQREIPSSSVCSLLTSQRLVMELTAELKSTNSRLMYVVEPYCG